MKSFVRSIDFDFWDIISNGPFVPNWTKDDKRTVVKLKSEYTQDDYEILRKNSRVLYIFQCALNDETFNHVCYCEIAKDLWRKLTLLYEEANHENPNSSKRDNMLSNLSDKKESTHFCLMANEDVKDRDASDNDDDAACTSDDEEEDEKMKYDIPDEAYDSLQFYFIILDVKKETFLRLKI